MPGIAVFLFQKFGGIRCAWLVLIKAENPTTASSCNAAIAENLVNFSLWKHKRAGLLRLLGVSKDIQLIISVW